MPQSASATVAGNSVAPPRRLLTRADITYLGSWDITNPYCLGLSCRYVNGQIRLLTCPFNTSQGFFLREYLPPVSGTTMVVGATYANAWNGFSTNSGHRVGVEFSPRDGRVWMSLCNDYAGGNLSQVTASTCSFSPGPNGEVNDWKGWYGVDGLSEACSHDGCIDVPSWFQQQYGVGPKMLGSGGYVSLWANRTLPAAKGLFQGFIPDPRGFPGQPRPVVQFPPPSCIPASACKVGADYRPGGGSDWYSGVNTPAVAFVDRPFDRYPKESPSTDYCDGGDPRTNPTTRPTVPPSAVAQWLNDAPDPQYTNRINWQDVIGPPVWIDDDAGTRPVHGLMYFPSVATGYVWYQGSNIHSDGRAVEAHVIDPAHVGQAVQGTRKGFDVRPVSAWDLMLPGLTPVNSVASATFDPVANTLFVLANNLSGNKSQVHRYFVGGG